MQKAKGKRQKFNLKFKILSFTFWVCTLHFALCTTSVYAQEPSGWEKDHCYREETVNDQAIEVATLQGFECIFRNVVRVLTPIAGLLVFIMLIVGAFQLMTAGGEAKQIQKAQKTFTYAVFGLLAFIGIWFILRLIQAITGVDVTKFEIPK